MVVKVGLLVTVLALALVGSAQAFPVLDCEKRPDRPDVTPAEQQASDQLFPLMKCDSAVDDRSPCNIFVGHALETLFGNTDFKTGDDAYMLANDIVNGLENPGNAGWTKLGEATDQGVLDAAQEKANAGLPVVAARAGVDGRPGHVALIIPGTAQAYDFDGFMWNGLVAPNTASFFLDKPERGFIGCPLSAVWHKPSGVGLYYKG
jgi:hypothetical protein